MSKSAGMWGHYQKHGTLANWKSEPETPAQPLPESADKASKLAMERMNGEVGQPENARPIPENKLKNPPASK